MNAESRQAVASAHPAAAPQPAVRKRNGQLVPFFHARILGAVSAAWREHLGLAHEAALPAAAEAAARAAAEEAAAWCRERAAAEPVLFIEDIQDAVVRVLRDQGHAAVADRYEAYRRRKAALRFERRRITVEKRDGRAVSFKPEKIAVALGKAFAAAAPLTLDREREILALTERVVSAVKAEIPSAGTAHIERIQDLAVAALEAAGHRETAERYSRYREERLRARRDRPAAEPPELQAPVLRKEDGSLAPLDLAALRAELAEACRGLEEDVSVDELLRQAAANCPDGMPEAKLPDAVLMAARSRIELDPDYGLVAARLLLKRLYAEVAAGALPPPAVLGVETEGPLGSPGAGRPLSLEGMAAEYPRVFAESVRRLVETEHLDPRLLDFDLERLGRAIQPERDLQFQFLGLQILYDRYFIHHEGRRLELPQSFWMRVAMGLALGETDREGRAIEFYEAMSEFRFTPSTPTLFNAGTRHPQLSSCFLTTVGDDLDVIFQCIKDNAMLSKWSGGLGNDWTPVRALGSRIKGTNGKSQGIIPFLKVANDTAVAVNQGGKRQGAVCAYLEVWHLDFEDFLDLRKNTGDDRRRTHDMHTAAWIPDLFMKRVLADGEWTLLSSNEAPDLHDLYGRAFERRYEEYEALAKAGRLRQHKTVSAVALWRRMLSMVFETGHPWITFKDPSNVRSPQDHAGVVHSSNLCTEILLNTSREETAVCNLGSVNLAAHVSEAGLDFDRLGRTVRTAVRMLDNVIDLNFYPTPEARASNLRHRPVGLGVMGFQDALYAQGLSYASPRAVGFADRSMEAVSWHAIRASAELAAERGAYPSFKGSKWDRGLLPIDTVALLKEERGGGLDMDASSALDWAPIREAARRGMRNSNVMAIAPTATIGNIVGVTQSIEPTYKNLFAKSNLSGEFAALNPYLVRELKALGLWDKRMLEDLKYFDGSLQEIPRVPRAVKDRYATAFEMGPEWLISCASRRQKWIDMGQSLNLYLAEPSGKKLHAMYLMAWEKGLKTTYYLRSLGATRVEQSTSDVNRYGDPLGQKRAAGREEAPAEAKACRTEKGDDCEACQ